MSLGSSDLNPTNIHVRIAPRKLSQALRAAEQRLHTTVQPTSVPELPHRAISWLGMTLVVLSGLLTSAANLMFRTAMSDTHSLPATLIVQQLLHRPAFYAAWICYVTAALVWFRVLTIEPLSSSYPILMGVTFIIVSVGAVLLFREEISVMKAAGMAAILLGITLVARN